MTSLNARPSNSDSLMFNPQYYYHSIIFNIIISNSNFTIIIIIIIIIVSINSINSAPRI